MRKRIFGLGVMAGVMFLLSSFLVSAQSVPIDCASVSTTGGFAPIYCSQYFNAVQTGVQINTIGTVGALSNLIALLPDILGILILVVIIFYIWGKITELRKG